MQSCRGWHRSHGSNAATHGLWVVFYDFGACRTTAGLSRNVADLYARQHMAQQAYVSLVRNIYGLFIGQEHYIM